MMNVKISCWKYLDKDCVLAQSVSKEALEEQATTLQSLGYAIDIQPDRVDTGQKFYFLMAIKSRTRWH